MEAQGRIRLLTESLLLSALAHQKRGDLPRALNSFERALRLAEPGGYMRLFLDEGLPIRPLLQAAVERNITVEYARKLLAALEDAARSNTTAAPSTEKQTKLVEPLTDREIELLRLIAAGLSNQEIAERLFISLPTVKWHISNIFSKLGVRSRTQAVVLATSLGVLPAE
jgi:LuxR family transcriptional regulator, maltose regulon positive regulatory protein